MTDFPTSFEQFLLWERVSRDTLEVKRIYVDMAGDLIAGVVLSQIIYWHLPNREGKPRLQVEKQGKFWLAKGRAEWWDECRISPKQADRALDVLREKKLIEVRLFKFGAAPTKHIRLIQEEFLNVWREHLQRLGKETVPECRPGQLDFYQRSKSISTKGRNRNSPKVKMDIHQTVKSLTEITTETTTAASSPGQDAPLTDPAAAALFEELAGHGVSKGVAQKLVLEKPEACRRYLDYLPYAEVRTSAGAWLANAIRDEYGPPPAFEKAKAQAREEQLAKARAAIQNARKSHEDAIREEKEAKLRETLRLMEKTHSDEIRAFNEHVEEERAKASRIVLSLSPKRREEYLATFDQPEGRLKLFGAWLEKMTSLPSIGRTSGSSSANQ